MKNLISKITIFFIIFNFIFFYLNISSASNEIMINVQEKSDKVKEWENLSEEERSKFIQPSYSNVNLKESVKKSTYNNLLNRRVGNSLASSYKITGLSLKDQELTGMCWAFSFSSVLESTGNKRVYSPAYIDYMATKHFNRQQGGAGNSQVSLAVAVNGTAPILETDMPFSSVYNETTNTESTNYLTPIAQLSDNIINQDIDARVMNARIFASIYKEKQNDRIIYKDGENNEYTETDVASIRKTIKQHIQDYGAISSTMYSDIVHYSTGRVESLGGYYNPTTCAYFCGKETDTNESKISENHAVTIIGWDDNYAITNFNEENRPTTPGAYIVLNSYGEKVGNKGIMYISYEDLYIERELLGIEEIEEYNSKDEITYDKIYQYDELGANYEIGFNTQMVYGANVFSRDDSKDEYLSEVGIYLLSTEGIEVYVNAANDDKTKLTKVSVETDNITPGYHVIKLSSPVRLTGNKFVVAIKYINKEKNVRVPLEINPVQCGITSISGFWDTAKANTGESFISLDNGTTWIDVNGIPLSGNAKLKDTNACIKAFVKEAINTNIRVESVKLSKNTTTIKVGQTDTLQANVLPTNATNKNVKWTSSNTNIVTVDNGVVKGISKGSATVTVTTIDGNLSASCIITVEEEQTEKVNVTGIKLDKQTELVNVGESITIAATVLPEDATNKKMTWTSSDNKIAKVENGIVTGISKGIAVITVLTVDGSYKATCSVTVKEAEQQTINVKDVSLNKDTLEIEVGDETNLVAKITPLNATNQKVKWTSSNTDVATISDTGIIKAIKEGTAKITVTTLDGAYTATCLLKVNKKTNTDDDIYKDNEITKQENNNQNKVKNEESKNNTINSATETKSKAPNVLPNTGSAMAFIPIVIVILAIVGAILYKIK